MSQLALLSVRTTPATRGACEEGPRPCRYTACRHHLWAEDERPGRPWKGKHPLPVVRVHSEQTCALDVAQEQEHRDARGRLSRERVGEHLGITGERVRQIEGEAIRKLLASLHEAGIETERIMAALAIEEQDVDVAPKGKRLPVVSAAQLDLLK